MVALQVEVHTAAENNIPIAFHTETSDKSPTATAMTPRGKVKMRQAPMDVSLQLPVPNPSAATRLN
jgi:hypothetical protein